MTIPISELELTDALFRFDLTSQKSICSGEHEFYYRQNGVNVFCFSFDCHIRAISKRKIFFKVDEADTGSFNRFINICKLKSKDLAETMGMTLRMNIKVKDRHIYITHTKEPSDNTIVQNDKIRMTCKVVSEERDENELVVKFVCV